MILTSHYMEDIEQLCERIVIIREGEFVYDGSLDRVLNQYAGHKVISAELNDAPHDAFESFPPALGEVLSSNPSEFKIKVARQKVAEAASTLLQRLPVIDLKIDEEDISDIVARLLRETKA